MAKFFFCVFMDRDEVEAHKLAKAERGQYPAILTEQTWSIKDLLYGFRGTFCSRDTAGSPERARWLYLARSGSQSQRAIWFILPACGASYIIKDITWPQEDVKFSILSEITLRVLKKRCQKVAPFYFGGHFSVT